jgi:hypothetical protein
MADFGLAVLVQPKAGVKVDQCSGTLGYADPLYISSSVVTEGSEVYSFGMVMLEALTGKPPAVQGPGGQIQYLYAHLQGDYRAVLPMVEWRAGWPPEIAQRIARLAIACIERSEAKRPVFVDIVARLRDLLNRTFLPVKKPAAPQFIYPQVVPNNDPLLRNQAQLEEALRKVNAAGILVEKKMLEKWNPFEIEDDESNGVDRRASADSGRSSIEEKNLISDHTEVTEKKCLHKSVPPEDPEVTEKKCLHKAVPPEDPEVIDKLVHKAVADFDEELKDISKKNYEQDIDKAMNTLFPSSNSTVGSPPSPEENDPVDDRRREAAKHLLAAGFTLEQTREALKRTTSVEAAVEWIVEQKWL